MRNHEIRKYRGNVMSAVTDGRNIFLTLAKILDLLVFFHQACKNVSSVIFY